ncbi:hypothetical protein [Pseudomonas sp. PS02288]|uniref:hypothetical protein n=1 Tax=Pseudomonas sp. PS02288 TaxID=2991443 RepID=UPI00249ABC29|nr:hypothetical protein [Pseudomonas sp. PS02288]
MNVAPLPLELSNDYRTAMQFAAVAYLQRNDALHLAGEQLMASCVQYLVTSLGVPQFMVQRIADLAVAEFEARQLAPSIDSPTLLQVAWVGIDFASAPDVAVLIDTRTGDRYSVPARLLPSRLTSRPQPVN